MIIQSSSKVFSLHEPRDLLAKLYSDIQDFSEIPKWNSALRVYRAIDGFLTLWHMADWFWVSLRRDKEAFNRWKATCPEQSDLDSFKKWLCEKCVAMRVAQQVATASKHVRVNYDDVGIAAVIDFETLGDRGLQVPRGLVIRIDGETVSVDEVLMIGRDFWDAFLDNIMPEEYFPIGDDSA